MDSLTKERRSWNMSQIKDKDTIPEVFVRSYFFRKGLRFRKNVKSLLGKPDIVLKKYMAVVFVNGCFWHCHDNCKAFRIPKSNSEYWRNKLYANKERDLGNYKKLTDLGYRIFVIWECEYKNTDILDCIILKITNEISK
jgi:DNA mismatch endonuclease (patch repair protein)